MHDRSSYSLRFPVAEGARIDFHHSLPMIPMALLLSLCVSTSVLVGCTAGGGGSGATADGEEFPPESTMSGTTDDEQPFADPAGTPAATQTLASITGQFDVIPEVVDSEIRADSGLQVAWTRGTGQDDVAGSYVEAQWQYMQECVGVVAAAPLVIITPGPVERLGATDDVLRDIDGSPTASSSSGVVSILQVQVADFDGSLGNPGFILRSIMGRHLWLSANLPERDYPFGCARTPAPEADGTL